MCGGFPRGIAHPLEISLLALFGLVSFTVASPFCPRYCFQTWNSYTNGSRFLKEENRMTYTFRKTCLSNPKAVVIPATSRNTGVSC